MLSNRYPLSDVTFPITLLIDELERSFISEPERVDCDLEMNENSTTTRTTRGKTKTTTSTNSSTTSTMTSTGSTDSSALTTSNIETSAHTETLTTPKIETTAVTKITTPRRKKQNTKKPDSQDKNKPSKGSESGSILDKIGSIINQIGEFLSGLSGLGLGFAAVAVTGLIASAIIFGPPLVATFLAKAAIVIGISAVGYLAFKILGELLSSDGDSTTVRPQLTWVPPKPLPTSPWISTSSLTDKP